MRKIEKDTLTATMPLRILAFIIVLSTFPAFGQSVEQDCPEITLTAPDHSYPWNPVRIKAATLKSSIKGDWLITKRNFRTNVTQIEKVRDVESVEVNAWQSNDSGTITAVITVTRTARCATERLGVVTVVLTENPGSPLIIDEFGIIGAREQKARLDVVATFMEERPKQELLIFLSFPKSDRPAKRIKMIRDVLFHLSDLRKFPKHRITFLVEEAENLSVKFQPVPQDLVEVYASMHLEVKAERLSEYERLFK